MTLSQQTPSGIAFDRSGPPHESPIVLVHAGVADRRMWDPQWDELTATRDSIRLDLRGFGESTTPPPSGALNHTADLLETLDHLQISRWHLVGSSLGAGVATEAAITRPHSTRSLLLCTPGGSLLAEMTADLRLFIDAEESALARDDLDAAVEANVISWIVGRERHSSDVDPTVLQAVRAMQRHAFSVAKQLGDIGEVEMDPPALDRLDELTTPTRVLVGGHDMATTHDSAQRVSAGARRVERVDWDDVAHLPSMEQPARFSALLLEWVRSHD